MLKICEKIQPVDKNIGNEVRAYLDTLTKPIGSLGMVEELAIQLGEITSSRFPTVSPPGVIVFAADHGVAGEGVSAYPQEVTVQMVHNFLNGGAAINVLAKQIEAKLDIVDIGVAGEIAREGLISRKVRYGTGNFLKEDAMSPDEALEAIQVGMDVANDMIQRGAKCLLLGEMGIGNTTSSSAILSVLLGENNLERIVGTGTGISVQQIKHKQQVIKQAIENRHPDPGDPLDILSKLGGLEIAGMIGAIFAAAEKRIPILIDGFISTVSAVLAVEMCQHIRGYLIIGHQSKEIGHRRALELLKKRPLLDLELRLGEGSGAALAYPIVEASARILKNMATFSAAGVSESTIS
ncbi:nicotinate-nucleotide--dimethylbenzimidazole phosphoribosyltransferase [Sutcliffiella sp. NPDC057660]|uniref:nicotinate-nucleotide--dimethylbenzimidazole phosphoribosyltransferase n=1 Tax=Sutcliffiella sp. NPDC057660 TaxID=3346199 RepID=UPI0036B91C48